MTLIQHDEHEPPTLISTPSHILLNYHVGLAQYILRPKTNYLSEIFLLFEYLSNKIHLSFYIIFF